jgi:hypothetical protein
LAARLRKESIEQLEHIYAAHADNVGEYKSAMVMLKVHERKAKLVGIDALEAALFLPALAEQKYDLSKLSLDEQLALPLRRSSRGCAPLRLSRLGLIRGGAAVGNAALGAFALPEILAGLGIAAAGYGAFKAGREIAEYVYPLGAVNRHGAHAAQSRRQEDRDSRHGAPG